MKESTKIKIGAIIATAFLLMAGCVFGQDVKARSFRDEGKKEYDSKHYFNVALIIATEGVVEQTDSIQLFIRELDAKEALLFTVCEKTDVYFAYDKCYTVLIYRRGYATTQLSVNAGVKVREYGGYIPINLEKGDKTTSSGIVVWDSRINDIHYYPDGGHFLSQVCDKNR